MNIKAISSALPDWNVENSMIQEWCGLSVDIISSKLGIDSRRFLTSDQSGTDLSVQAVQNLALSNPDFDLSRIGLLIVVTQNPDYHLPHNSALLQHRLGLNQTTACFDISLGCSGYVYALSAAKGFMFAEQVEEALVVTCDPYSKCMSKSNRDVVALFGDAATVTWLRGDGNGKVGRGNFGTDGSGAGSLILRAAGAVHPNVNFDGKPVLDAHDTDKFLHMNGRAIFNFLLTRVPRSVEACLARNGLDRDGVDYFVFHQASRYLLETLRDKMDLIVDRVPIALSKTGNTVSSTIPLVLESLMKQGKCQAVKVLLCGFGVGFSWASNVITFGDGS
jgi:3-oxoacyl-[acyl-carrier-protein] synthase-3